MLLTRITANVSPMKCLLYIFLIFFFRLCLLLVVFHVYFCTVHSFILEIHRHFSTFLVMDMTIEKFQKVATTQVDACFKARCLWLWNSPIDAKTKNKFPTSLLLSEKILDDWLHKVILWAHVLQHLFYLFPFNLCHF